MRPITLTNHSEARHRRASCRPPAASPHLSTRQYARILKTWVASIGLDANACGTHSMRRTKPTLIYRSAGNLRAVQLLLGHTKIESTVRYLGTEVDDALEIAEQTDAYRDRSVAVAVGWPLTDQDQRVSRASIADVVR